MRDENDPLLTVLDVTCFFRRNGFRHQSFNTYLEAQRVGTPNNESMFTDSNRNLAFDLLEAAFFIDRNYPRVSAVWQCLTLSARPGYT